MTLSPKFVSVIVPLTNAGGYVQPFIRECLAVLAGTFRDYELILVDDASTDDTAVRVTELLAGTPQLRMIRLARRFGSDVGFVAGLDTAIGDYAVLMRAERDPPNEIPAMVERASQGIGVVTGIDSTRRWADPFTVVLRNLFHAYSNRAMGLNYPRHATTFQVLTRSAVSAVTRTRAKRPTFPVLASQVGYGEAIHSYTPMRRPGAPATDGLFGKIDRGLSIIVNSSIAPLRTVSYLGIGAAGLNLLYAGYVVGVNLLKPHVAEGWTTLSLQISVMFFFVFLVLAVICEYVGRTLGEAVDRPLYHVLEERNGSALLPMDDRKNVEELAE